MRLPFEPNAPLWLRPWIALVKARLDRAGIFHNDYVVGIAGSGRMDEAAWLTALASLSGGVAEIYCHPAIAGERALTDGMRDYRHADELQALLSPDVARAIRALGARLGGFADVSE